jgi:molybdenum cofactor biosynthesis enzyme MoaA
VDSGTKETFIKVKRKDFYDKVWENIEKYAAVQPESNRVKTKFILIPNLNDTKEEIDAWIAKSIECGIKHLAFDIEMMWYNKNKDNLPESLFEIVKYTLDKIKENNLDLELIDRSVIISKELEKRNKL